MPPLLIRPKPNLVTAFSQTPLSSLASKAMKKSKADLYWLDLIGAFNARLQRHVVFVDGLDDEAIEIIIPIERLTERAIIDDNSDND